MATGRSPVLWASLGVGLALGCGNDTTAPAISVAVTPAVVSIPTGGDQAFSATVENDDAANGVSWSITGCTGSCGTLSGVTSTSVIYVAPATAPPGTIGVTATSVSDGTKSAAAAVTITTAGLSIQRTSTNSGDQQTDTVGATLPQPLRVLVLHGAEPAPGISVNWTASQGSLSAASTMTDALGIATVNWTLGLAAGTQVAGAHLGDGGVGDSVVVFVAVARPRPASRLVFVDQPVNVFAGSTLLPLRVAALDRYDNVATDFVGSVTMTLTPGGSLVGTTTAAGAFGVATFVSLSTDQIGTGYTLVASADGLGDATSAAFDVVAPVSGRIAFGSDRADMVNMCPNLYVMDADGSGVVLIDPHWGTGYISCNVTGPAWSPDGAKMAFMTLTRVSSPDTEYVNSIWLMNADGSQATQLSLPHDSLHGYYSAHPAWSPDGTRIAGTVWLTAKVRRCGGRGPGTTCTWVWVVSSPSVFVANTDGSGFLNLADGLGPTWSPDGRIAFTNGVDVLVMNADGTGFVNLTNESTPNVTNDAPAWSPDGTKIAFRSNRSGHSDLYVMNADGSGITQRTADTATEGRPAWSPDGMKVAFASDRDGDYEIYVMNADGSGVVRLTDNAAADKRPAWTR